MKKNEDLEQGLELPLAQTSNIILNINYIQSLRE